MNYEQQLIPIPPAETYGLIVDSHDPRDFMQDHELVGRCLVHDLTSRGYKALAANRSRRPAFGEIVVASWDEADDLLAATSTKALVYMVVRSLVTQRRGPWSAAARYRKPAAMAVFEPVLRSLGLEQGYLSARAVIMGLRVMALAQLGQPDTVWLTREVQVPGVVVAWPDVVTKWDRPWLCTQASLRGVATLTVELRKAPANPYLKGAYDLPTYDALATKLHAGPLGQELKRGTNRAVQWFLNEVACRYLGSPMILHDGYPSSGELARVANAVGYPEAIVATWERRPLGHLLTDDPGAPLVDQWLRKHAGRRVVVVGSRLNRRLGLEALTPGQWLPPPRNSAASSAGQVMRVVQSRATSSTPPD